jgi:hypothetical protein
MMLCAEFEDVVTEYLDNGLENEAAREFAEHSLSCPLCHQLLDDVRGTLGLFQVISPEPPIGDLHLRLIQTVAPELDMTCHEFEESLTDYLDGFLPAPLYHRWERHAAACRECTELPGIVVRTIGACYASLGEPLEVPFGLHQKVLKSTLGTVNAAEKQSPMVTRLAERLRLLLDPIVAPQFAAVATMILIAVLVLTSTVSSDGSIGGMYRASVRLAEQTYKHGETTARHGEQLKNDLAVIVMGGQSEDAPADDSNKEPGGNRR